MGNFNLAGQCTINEAYNYIHANQTKMALQLIKNVTVSAMIRQDAHLIKVCAVALLFLKRVQKVAACGVGDVVDDLQRVRTVTVALDHK